MTRLWTRGELAQLDWTHSTPSLSHRVGEFEKIVTSPDFPCTFARLPFATDSVWYGLIPLDSEYATQVLDALRNLVVMSRTEIDTTLVIFLPPRSDESAAIDLGTSDLTLEDDFDVARAIVHEVMGQSLAQVPESAHSHWSLELDGVELFLNFSSPRHQLRLSRNVGDCLTLIAQPRESFEIKGRSRQRVREHIRSRIRSYDHVAPHPALGTFGEPGNREAHQYFLGDGLTNFDPTA